MTRLQRSGAIWFLLVSLGMAATAADGIATVIESKVICKQPGRYIGWPTITVTKTGELLAVFSGDRTAHVCPWGKVQMVRSKDGGKTWSAPATISDSPLDDRDAGIIETKKGTLVVSWFTSLAFTRRNSVKPSWKAHADKLDAETRKKWLGNFVCRSSDGGKTWSEPIDSLVSAPHGPIQLARGDLIYVGKYQKVGAATPSSVSTSKLLAAALSKDDGKSWAIAGYISVPENVKPGADAFHEGHVVEASPGKLVAMYRHHGKPGRYYLWQTESGDGGKTWTPLHQTKIWGYPPHLIRLKDGRLLVSYGRRKPPFSERACISRDGGKTWDVKNEITLCAARNADLGYPASVQLKDGSIVTVFYQVDKAREKTCLMATRWRLED